MTDQPDTLLEAVLALTDPYDEALDEPARNRWGRKMQHISRPSRIDQLETAITPSGNSAGGGALARERNIIDTGALDLYRRLLRDVNQAATHVGAPNGDDPAAVLKWWLLTARTKHPTDAFEQEWAGKWEQWARRIDTHLDPPVVIELMRPCPICGETRAVDPNAPGGPAIVTALVVQYRRSDAPLEPDAPQVGAQAIPEHSNAFCRFCEAVWKGRDGVRAIAFDIEQAERNSVA